MPIKSQNHETYEIRRGRRKKERRVAVTFAIAGALPRIGTTTQALQLVQYLQKMGYQAVYIERNSSAYPQKVLSLYQGAKRYQGGVMFEGILMYGQEAIQEIKEENYDFLIKDYGNIKAPSFEHVSFLEQKYHFLVCGVKANEILDTEEALDRYGADCSGFCFSFVLPKDRVEILNMMREKKKHVYFSEYIPDPFVFHASSALGYQKIFLGKQNKI